MRRRAFRPQLVLPVVLLTGWWLPGCQANESESETASVEDQFAAIEQKLQQLEEKIDASRLASNDVVHIQVRGVAPNTEIVEVFPPTKRACQPASTDCAPQVRWVLAGPLAADWKVEVKEKPSEEPTNCFQAFELDRDSREVTQQPAENCRRTGMSWEYDVILLDPKGGEKDREDPLVVMTWSP